MDLLNLFMLVTGALVFASVVAGLYSARSGLSFLLIFLVVGMLAGEDGPGGIVFDNVPVAMWVGSTALGVILLDGGLRTRLATFRTGLRPAVWLATIGVILTAGLTGLAASWLTGLPLLSGLLIGSIVGSTDAAAVFSLLKTSGLRVSERLSSTLEIESGLNDPMAIFLVVTLIELQLHPQTMGVAAIAASIAQQGLVGAAFGIAGGLGIGSLLLRLPLHGAAAGLTGLLLLSSGIAVFGAAGWLGGSGFLAVYLFGMLAAHRAPRVVEGALAALDGYAWLAQALLFLLLGLLVTPRLLLDTLLPALGVALALMLVARPLAVAAILVPLRFTRGEIGFVSWVGLRGAVPVVLAMFPLMAGVPHARELFEVAFVCVLASLMLQGATLVRAARLFGVNLPDVEDEPAVRRVYGDFVLDGSAPVRELCAFYGLTMPEHDGTLAQWLESRLQRPPVVGDGIDWSGAHFAVRQMDGARVMRVGLSLGAPP